MKKTINSLVLYSDTNSLLHEIRREEFFEKTASEPMLQNHFDFYKLIERQSSSLWHKQDDRTQIPRWDGNESHPKNILSQSQDLLIVYENQQKISAQVVSRFAQTSLKRDVCKRVLLSVPRMKSNNRRCGSSIQLPQTTRYHKVSISASFDKRFLQNEGTHSLLIDHFETRGRQMENPRRGWLASRRAEGNHKRSSFWSTPIKDFKFHL